MSPQKRQGKGSFPVPYPKMPFGIFLFAQKFNFQKSEENGEKRRKPEKISGFSVGIFLSTRLGGDTRKLAPLRGAMNREPDPLRFARRELGPMKEWLLQNKKHPLGYFSF